ncbi:hypothetical protein ACFLY4_00725 [Chloroflexota bacterium]|jgi:hypothetical protein
MCCFFATLFFFGPRLAFLIYWLLPAGQLKIAATFNTFIWPLLGLIFLPWTTLMYVIVYPIVGFDWLWLGLAVLADISSYAAGATRRKDASWYTGP